MAKTMTRPETGSTSPSPSLGVPSGLPSVDAAVRKTSAVPFP